MSGETTSGSLSTALPTIIQDARMIREFDGVWQRTYDKRSLGKGQNYSWNEFSINQINAQDITETTTNNNAQTLSGQLLSSTPQMAQILVKITDRTHAKIASVVDSKLGSLAGNAMKRKKDEDYLDLFSGFATTVSPGTGNPLSFGHITAGVANIRHNATEGSMDEIYAVLHGFGVKDIQDELLAGVGTYNIPSGMTETVFKQGFSGSVATANVFTDDNMVIDSTPDANGAIHAKSGVVAVQGMGYHTETRRDPSFGGGADEVYITDEYSFVERTSAGTQVKAYLLKHDATAPTS
jgi:hypothetical protein